jgi:hypothetical protein
MEEMEITYLILNILSPAVRAVHAHAYIARCTVFFILLLLLVSQHKGFSTMNSSLSYTETGKNAAEETG